MTWSTDHRKKNKKVSKLLILAHRDCRIFCLQFIKVRLFASVCLRSTFCVNVSRCTSACTWQAAVSITTATTCRVCATHCGRCYPLSIDDRSSSIVLSLYPFQNHVVRTCVSVLSVHLVLSSAMYGCDSTVACHENADRCISAYAWYVALSITTVVKLRVCAAHHCWCDPLSVYDITLGVAVIISLFVPKSCSSQFVFSLFSLQCFVVCCIIWIAVPQLVRDTMLCVPPLVGDTPLWA